MTAGDTDSESKKVSSLVNRGLAWLGLASSFVWFFDIAATVIVLAFWVSPAQLGVATLAISVFPVLDRIADLGISSAVIQRDDHTPTRLSTVLWLNVLISLALLAILAFVAGPGLAAIQGEPVVALMLTAYGGKLVWQNIFMIPMALMRKELRFKELSIIQTIANFVDFGVKIGTAAAGFGIWCFVLGPLSREVAYAVLIQVRHPWRPRLVFQLGETTDWIGFGIKSSAHRILFFLYTNIDYQIVGYFFGAQANGYYKFAYDMVLEPCRAIAGNMSAIAFSAYSKLKQNRPALIEQFIRFTRLSMVIMLGFLAIVFVSADDMIGALWGERWVPATECARILCAVGLFRALGFVVLPLLDGIGRPGLALRYTSVAAVVLPIAFVLSAELLGDRLGYLSVAIAWVVGYPIAFAVLAVLTLWVLELRAVEYARRVMGIFGCAAAATAVGWAAEHAVGPMPRLARFAIIAAITAAAFISLLAYFQGLSPRTLYRAVKGES